MGTPTTVAIAACLLVVAGACASEGGGDEQRAGPAPRLTTTSTTSTTAVSTPPAAGSATAGGARQPVAGSVPADVSGCPGGWPEARIQSMEWKPSADVEGRFEVRIEGDVTNTTQHPVRVHSVEMIIRTEHGDDMSLVTAAPTDDQGRSHEPVLAPGATTGFLWGDYVYWDERRPGEHPDTAQIVDLNWRWDDPYLACPAG